MALAPSTKLPKCEDCRGSQPHVVNTYYFANGKQHVRHIWLCGDCEYRRENPDALPAVKMPNERRPRAMQKETLFDPAEVV